MENLWAPWRAEYFQNPRPKECIFCLTASQLSREGTASTDRENHVLLREKTCFVLLNRYPYSGGHLMVAPYRHTAEMNDLTDDELRDLMILARRCQNWLKQAFKPDGFNLGLNFGAAAGAGIVDHLHLHIVPRWNGDTNFMTVLNDTRILTDGLNQTWDRLMECIQKSG